MGMSTRTALTTKPHAQKSWLPMAISTYRRCRFISLTKLRIPLRFPAGPATRQMSTQISRQPHLARKLEHRYQLRMPVHRYPRPAASQRPRRRSHAHRLFHRGQSWLRCPGHTATRPCPTWRHACSASQGRGLALHSGICASAGLVEKPPA